MKFLYEPFRIMTTSNLKRFLNYRTVFFFSKVPSKLKNFSDEIDSNLSNRFALKDIWHFKNSKINIIIMSEM